MATLSSIDARDSDERQRIVEFHAKQTRPNGGRI